MGSIVRSASRRRWWWTGASTGPDDTDCFVFSAEEGRQAGFAGTGAATRIPDGFGAYTIASSIADGKALEVKPGSDTPITIKIRRKDGVKAGVTITAVRLANNTITTRGVFVAPEKDEAEIVLNVPKDAKVGLRQPDARE
jgi:hypothetical protein